MSFDAVGTVPRDASPEANNSLSRDGRSTPPFLAVGQVFPSLGKRLNAYCKQFFGTLVKTARLVVSKYFKMCPPNCSRAMLKVGILRLSPEDQVGIHGSRYMFSRALAQELRRGRMLRV